MGKITEIKLVGQPIFKQIMNLVDKVDIQGLVRKHESDYYYKSFKTRTHLFTMLFGILSWCDSMTEICEGLRAMGGKLNHLGMDQAPAKSTACDGLRNRSHKFFEELYFTLVKHYHSFLSGSRKIITSNHAPVHSLHPFSYQLPVERITPHSVTQNPVLINGMLSAGAMILLFVPLFVPLIK